MTDTPPELPPPDDPMAVARKYVLEHHDDDDGVHLLRRHAGGFYRWDGACSPELLAEDLRASVYAWAEAALYWKPVKVKGETTYELTPWAPTHRRRQPLPPMPRPATPTPHPPTTSKEDHVTQHRVRTSSTADGSTTSNRQVRGVRSRLVCVPQLPRRCRLACSRALVG